MTTTAARVMSGRPTATASVAAAAEFASAVDRDARFPIEAVTAMKDEGLLSCALPVELGGRGTSITDLAGIARALGKSCSSAAMVFAMHHTQSLTLAMHGTSGATAELTRTIAESESLLASATTEITTGGDVRSSTCSVIADGDHIVLDKNAPVISYGEYADYIFTTARRGPDSPPSDQVLVACPKSDTTLQKVGTWDVLGFRGTCSPGFLLSARTAATNVLPVDYATISAHTMLPGSHTLWASVWLGIADAAIAKAKSQVRAAARKSPTGVTPQAQKFADLLVVHQRFESSVAEEIRRYENFLASGEAEPTVGFAIAMNNLKLNASHAVVDVVTGALQLCGISGYREDHAASMGRLLRDSYGPQLMVSNDRIRANNAQLVLAYRG
ncbi:acyl-CoA dehydrogenase family protein [Williamsia phyllosphaerae]|uniref:Acyl-CoA dehydrogenase n=1 Tax=Williamsia phyllosphaerae TaxID=885042 RepID=A0ABQ1UB61_9NOCA|nr:acyl-CoA dehydrogenase family protein [Williamsia phyllosphaerae]GGF12802.1 acyl-CoA dehydrogenase [Williamsia phyllosphaerae]